ncbi:MAG: DUF1211 domain-containing protein [Firmicutes bacterium]|nr:DUF1211 domain-containing protein [Bacillota bacterium]MBR6503666.1 DUF1211 domain-containing protein [Bacillota bacterium]
MINKDRLLAITDGIVAIAATIMVLQLTIPEKAGFAAVAAQWPVMLAYIISFLQIFLAWHEHHDSVAPAEWINHRIFLVNCAWLFFITLLPFVTAIVGRSPDDRASMLLYIGVLFLVQLVISIESRMIVNLNNCTIVDAPVIRQIRIISFAGYAAAAVCALIHPFSSFIIILILTAAEIIVMCRYDGRVTAKIKKRRAEQKTENNQAE